MATMLREAFDHPFREIGAALGVSEANARQLGRRARTHLAERGHAPVHRAASDRLLQAFLDAARTGAVTRLEHLLAADASSHSEHGRRAA
jgi:RNA polymerase sigma-70 factor (ECF subfamily)